MHRVQQEQAQRGLDVGAAHRPARLAVAATEGTGKEIPKIIRLEAVGAGMVAGSTSGLSVVTPTRSGCQGAVALSTTHRSLRS